MEPNFHALQLIAEIAIGIVGFSAILIALSRSSDMFSGPDNFRVRLLTYSAFGAMFGGLLPFGIFNIDNAELSWKIICWSVCLYSVIGLLVFPKRMLLLRDQGYKHIFPLKVFLFQTGLLATIFTASGLMITGYLQARTNIYVGCLILFLVQSTLAFIRTMFVRVD
ncbi:MAG: hypothetical protein HN621_05490 [Porticoccaceae bacterium]|nr:hypothetical protein [Porticoccaceae bacterium]